MLATRARQFGRLSSTARFAPVAGNAVQMQSQRFFSQQVVDCPEVRRLRVLQAVQTVDLPEFASDPALEKPVAELRKVLESHGAVINQDGSVPVPQKRDLVLWGLLNGTPFVAFGFLDNALMLLAGDYLDSQMGATLGISTMMACAIGNIIGDVAGLFASNPIEGAVTSMGKKLNLPMPKLSNAQKVLGITRMYKTLGCVIGITTGCLIGMFPLIWPTEWRMWNSNNKVWRDGKKTATE